MPLPLMYQPGERWNYNVGTLVPLQWRAGVVARVSAKTAATVSVAMDYSK
jgi:hypothetical protein